MSKCISIKVGEGQPVDCPNCEKKNGYHYADYMKIHYTSFHSENGKLDSGAYTDSSTLLNAGKTAYCNQCLERLPFKLEREDGEELKSDIKHSKSWFV
jgi:hypothetical protein